MAAIKITTEQTIQLTEIEEYTFSNIHSSTIWILKLKACDGAL